ncbi:MULTISPECIES: ParB/RepB/Spo0J family partition protein [unclassified Variovorax]|uniref:ParB/RepB/Spo0J family partition protein n=1 Tax=unclassified Variovorax TaxID=663243 RepID=UPI000838EB86|nr:MULTISPECIES: ParB/RepB/Spo0J family partition protein [unclassified Variovorax]PNG48906.1 Chromosome-partitioning protein Spo0J [Variovorax sp. B2]PNG49413.1 Chromosome-partitioning protein Spo0J [Variovorax sp. B4]VTV18280.1 plasmid partitioning protein RepB [Variovorax sp. WDL1]
MARNLMEKSQKIQVPEARSASTPQTPPSKPKTAPGTLMGFMEGQSTVHQENKVLRDRAEEAERVAEEFKGATPVKMLDPKRIRRSDWANRDPASFDGLTWDEFKDDILKNGGNEVPIRVRPLPDAVEGCEFEIIYGHRRHQACLELGLPIRAQVEDATEHMLFVAMELENRSRKDLSPWEQGMFYAKALDKGLYPSARKLAEAIRRDSSGVNKALGIARLPTAVVEAFASPLEIQYRWAQPLHEAHQSDPDGLLARAKAIAAYGRRQAPGAVFAQLVSPKVPSDGKSRTTADIEIGKVGRKATAVLTSDRKGRAILKFQVDLPAKKRQALAAYAERLLLED